MRDHAVHVDIVAIDPGIANLGIASLYGGVHQTYYVDTSAESPILDRLMAIAACLAALPKADVYAFESQAGVIQRMSRADRNISSVARRIPDVCGILIGIAAAYGSTLYELPPTAGKRWLAAKARASDEEMIAALKRRFPGTYTDIPARGLSHAADAMGVLLAAKAKHERNHHICRARP
jgi:Holliday junction resolvasome RuvABC endonuclease subunit